ncbi:MAG TPA: YHS domain-containing protein [Rhodocyclaceae bacterium]|jgi:YHS domain-containing protein
MTKTMTTSHDPVCGMDVEVAQSSHSTTYKGLVFHFCSPQCLERFSETPTLYTSGQRTADIQPMLKRRKLRLAGGTPTDIQHVCQQIGEMMGILSISTERDYLIVEYDLRQATLVQIEAIAISHGLQLKGGFHGFRRGLWKFTESNELQNAAHLGTGACCSRPPAKIR